MAPLEQLIRNIQTARRPLTGIRFGHQMVAPSLGRKVERAANWITGLQTCSDTQGTEFTVNAWHRDQVVALPPGATVFARGEGCTFEGLRYPGPILTLQPYPEFGPDCLLGLHAERGSTLPVELQSHISETAHSHPPSYAYLAPLLRDTFLSALSCLDGARLAR